jgi:hypothetical protein
MLHSVPMTSSISPLKEDGYNLPAQPRNCQ